MALKLYEESSVRDIAYAIRAKTGGTETYKIGDMANAISDIQSGGATEPYAEETYDSSGNLIDAKLYGHTIISKYSFYMCDYLQSVSLPEGVTSIRTYAFYNCTKLELTSLPEGVTSIGSYAFNGCTNLALTSLPESLTKIWDYVFQNCTKLTTITFKGTLTSISSNAFNSCTNLTEINVPWAEGAVSGAPWGATNATINYNYTGE